MYIHWRSLQDLHIAEAVGRMEVGIFGQCLFGLFSAHVPTDVMLRNTCRLGRFKLFPDKSFNTAFAGCLSLVAEGALS